MLVMVMQEHFWPIVTHIADTVLLIIIHMEITSCVMCRPAHYVRIFFVAVTSYSASVCSTAGKPETSSEDSSDKPFKGLVFYIPGDQTGMVIGKEGKNITQVESETNTIIKVVERSELAQLSRNTTVAIIGREENCKRALYIILQNLRRKIFQHLATTETMTIPNHLVGRVIGKGGSTCNAIEKLSGARVKVESKEDLGLESLLDNSRICKITGMAEHIEEAKELIKRAMLGADIVQEATFAAVMVKLIKLFREMGFEFQDLDVCMCHIPCDGQQHF